jgi:hypothetical protein
MVRGKENLGIGIKFLYHFTKYLLQIIAPHSLFLSTFKSNGITQFPMPHAQKKREKPATADQSRLPILKERRTLTNNITLIENICQLLTLIIFNKL